MKDGKYYVVEQVPANMRAGDYTGPLWYCHMVGFPNIPVFGSIGTKKEAAIMCRHKNPDGKVHYR